MSDKTSEVNNVESGEALRNASFDDKMARAAERELHRIYSSFSKAQRAIRETLLEARSTDGYVSLKITGDGLATSVQIAPQLVTLGIPVLERSVLEAINNAAIAVQSLAIGQMQEAFTRKSVAMSDDVVNTKLNATTERTI